MASSFGSPFSLSQAGAQASQMMAEIPAEFLSQLKSQFGLSNIDETTARALWNSYNEQLKTDQAAGIGEVGEQLNKGSEVYQDTGQGQRRTDRTGALQTKFDNGPNAKSVYDDTQGNLDQRSAGDQATYGTNEGLIHDNTQQVMDQAGDQQEQINRIAADSYGQAGNTQQEMYDRLRDRNAAGYTGERGEVGSFVNDAGQVVDKSFSPDAVAARTGRAFAPAVASAALRARRAGGDASDPTYNAMLSHVESSRSRAVDDSLATGMSEQAQQKLAILRDRMSNNLGISKDEMNRDTGLTTQDEAIKRGLVLDKGAIQRGAASKASDQRITALNRGTDLNIGNVNASNTNAHSVFDAKTLAGQKQYDNAHTDLSTQDYLNQQANENDEYYNNLRAKQYGVGMGFTAADLARKDKATAALGASANAGFDRSIKHEQLGLAAGSDALSGFGANYSKEAANSGWASKLLSSLFSSAASSAGKKIGGTGGSGGSGGDGGDWGGSGGEGPETGGSVGNPEAPGEGSGEGYDIGGGANPPSQKYPPGGPGDNGGDFGNPDDGGYGYDKVPGSQFTAKALTSGYGSSYGSGPSANQMANEGAGAGAGGNDPNKYKVY